jgi:predicted DNA-binding protein with PD1-like motif
MPYEWETDARHPGEYHVVECHRGREFILRLTTGSDVFLAVQQFAKDRDIRFAKIHAAFMGGLQPARFLVWAPDTRDPDNWHHEEPRTVHNLTMVLSMSGIIHPRPVAGGGDEPFPAIHFVTGGAWDAPTTGGHLLEGSIVKGVLEIFITEILGIEVLHPHGTMTDPHADQFPENWYRQTT